MPDKLAVHAALLRALRASLETMAHAARQSAEGAVHEENRAEGDKDMRATEQSYVARGQAMRVEDLAEQIQRLEATTPRRFGDDDAIASTALVEVAIDGASRLFYVSAHGGGVQVEVDGVAVTVVTPVSPVGRALSGRRVGDDFELAQRGALRTWDIEAVR